ncbi:hypothetical protein C8J57DRAFT_1308880, partial [Mycena rebaudengoi]
MSYGGALAPQYLTLTPRHHLDLVTLPRSRAISFRARVFDRRMCLRLRLHLCYPPYPLSALTRFHIPCSTRGAYRSSFTGFSCLWGILVLPALTPMNWCMETPRPRCTAFCWDRRVPALPAPLHSFVLSLHARLLMVQAHPINASAVHRDAFAFAPLFLLFTSTYV